MANKSAVLEVKRFLSDQLCDDLLDRMKSEQHSTQRQWNTVTFHNCHSDQFIQDDFWVKTEREIEVRIEHALTKKYHARFNKCFTPNEYFLDGLTILEYPEYSNAPLHLDHQHVARGATHGSIAEGFTRDVGCLVFLNDEFDGGELVIDSYHEGEITIKPEKGKLVIFPFHYLYPHRTMAPINHSRFMLRVELFLRARSSGVSDGY